MARNFRSYAPEQAFLLPKAPHEGCAKGTWPSFLEEAVSELDLSTVIERYVRGRRP